MKRLVITAVAASLAVAALADGTAFAARGGNTSTTTTSSHIWISTVDGADMVAPLSSSPVLELGDGVRFGTTIEPLTGREYATIAVSCYQDVNGDGRVDTNLLGP